MGKVLFISNCDPFDIGGGSFATHAYIKALSEVLGGESYILLPEEGVNNIDSSILAEKYVRVKRRSTISKAISLITGDVQRYSEAVRHIINEHPDEFSFAVCNGSMSSGALVDFLHKNHVKVITVHHNYEPEYFLDNPTVSHLKSLFRYHITQLEKKSYKNSDFNIFLTNDDQQTFENVYGVSKGKNITLGVFEFSDISSFNPSPQINTESLTYVITGSLSTDQGVDGVMYFLKHLYKYLPSSSKVIIAGRNPADIITDECNHLPNVTVISNPENMQTVLEQGDVYICPTRLGGGLKLRIMDGLKNGLPVITHKCSARGYDKFFKSDYFKVFETEEQFSNVINSLLEQIIEKKINKTLIYEEYIKYFSYESGVLRLKEFIYNNY